MLAVLGWWKALSSLENVPSFMFFCCPTEETAIRFGLGPLGSTKAAEEGNATDVEIRPCPVECGSARPVWRGACLQT